MTKREAKAMMRMSMLKKKNLCNQTVMRMKNIEKQSK